MGAEVVAVAAIQAPVIVALTQLGRYRYLHPLILASLILQEHLPKRPTPILPVVNLILRYVSLMFS